MEQYLELMIWFSESLLILDKSLPFRSTASLSLDEVQTLVRSEVVLFTCPIKSLIPHCCKVDNSHYLLKFVKKKINIFNYNLVKKLKYVPLGLSWEANITLTDINKLVQMIFNTY